ncbi:MAG: thioredoxin-dependent thiol peroxidase [Candidatus Magasanikbacteria bacterium]|nr:thioredoxin-dependent thiol peroxidase [Candidatus Magasanikbacteria bacterium]
MIQLKQTAPNFTLADQTGQTHSLSDYKGQWVLLYFYPKDDTPGCTTEACQIRDSWSEFKMAGIVVLGVSIDSVIKHNKFAKKFDLPFMLLADEDKKVVELYGVWGEKKFMGRTYMGIRRTSFLINPAGEIAKVYEQVKADGHAQEILNDWKALSS